MLVVSLKLKPTAAMLFAIMLNGNLKEVDSLNGPTLRPIP